MTVAAPSSQGSLLTEDSHGVLRIAGSRIPLERVVYEWKAGASPEAIVESFPVLGLADVYATITHYLRNREQVEQYLKKAGADAERVQAEIERQFPPEDLRERLLTKIDR
jgi:uncharacterized protein (DUF433 family)